MLLHSNEYPHGGQSEPPRINFIRDDIARTLKYVHPDSRFEIRVKYRNGQCKSRIFGAGEHAQAVQFASEASGQVTAIWHVTGALGETHPRTKPAADTDITRRLVILADFDPVKPQGLGKNCSTTEAEHAAARARAFDCALYLLGKFSFPPMLIGDSGNGCHLLIVIDLPNDKAARDLIQRFLQALARQFDNSVVKIDTGTFNASRPAKLYGTKACKGPHTPQRPHRLAPILLAPDERPEAASPELLEAVITDNPPAKLKLKPSSPSATARINSQSSKTGKVIPFREILGEKELRFLRYGEMPLGQVHRGRMIFSVVLSALDNHWTVERITAELLDPSNKGTAKIFEKRNPAARTAYVQHTIDKALKFYSEHPPLQPRDSEIQQSLLAVLEHIDDLPWTGRTASTDRAVFQYHLKLACTVGRLTYTASIRQISENTGYGLPTVMKSNRRLIGKEGGSSSIKYHYLTLVEGSGMASTWQLQLDHCFHGINCANNHFSRDPGDNSNIISGKQSSHNPDGSDANDHNTHPGAERVIYCDHLAQGVTSAHDLWQPRGFGKSGWYVWSALRIDQGSTIAELKGKLNLSKPTIQKRLKQMTKRELVRCAKHRWYRVDQPISLFDELAEIMGTDGRGLRRKQHYLEDRRFYHQVLQAANQNTPNSNLRLINEAGQWIKPEDYRPPEWDDRMQETVRRFIAKRRQQPATQLS